MVLPPSAPHDAPRPAEAAWLDSLKLALGLSRSGLLLLVDHARPELLGELVRGLLPDHPELEVHTEVQRVLEVSHGSTLVLVPRAEDADWLNINRPVFAQHELRVVLFCDTETTITLARQAVDFFDWISHRVECPNRPPRFAVAGIRSALAARAPGIRWTGGHLEETFAAARPHSKLHKISAARPYAEMLAEVKRHRRAWIAWTDIDSYFRLRRVRWALAEAGHRTRAILVEPTVRSPGWWPVHAHIANIRDARGQLEKVGTPFPGRIAALNELEPEAIELMQSFLEHGLTGPTLDDALMNAPEESTPLLEVVGQRFARNIMRGEAPPPIMRAFKPQHFRQICLTELSTVAKQLNENEQAEFADLASWTAWATHSGPDLFSWSLDFAVEMLLRDRASTSIRWDLLVHWAITIGDLDAAECWAQHAVSDGTPSASFDLAAVKYAQGHLDEAESLIQGLSWDRATSPSSEHPLYYSVSATRADVLLKRGKPKEAEALLRQVLSTTSRPTDDRQPLHSILVYELAKALSAQGRYSEAEPLLRQSIDAVKTQGADLRNQGVQLDELAKVVSAQGRHGEAKSLLRQALSLMEHAPEAELAYVVSLSNLAALLHFQGEYVEAESLFRQALLLSERTVGIEHPYHSAALSGLSSALQAQGKYDEAETICRQALAIEERTVGIAHPSYAAVLHGLGTLHQLQGKYAEAEVLFRQVLAIRERALGSAHPDLCPTLSNLGAVLIQQGRSSEGEPFIARALEIAQATRGLAHHETAKVLNLLAQAQHLSGHREAPETARKAMEALTHALGPDHPTTRMVTPTLQAIIAKAPGAPGTGKP